MGDHDDYPHEHDRLYQAERGHEGGRVKSRDDGRDYRERLDREPPRDYERRRDERDYYDRRDEDRRRPRGDDRYERGPGTRDREYPDRRDVRSDPRDYGRERRRSRSRDRRRSRSRDRYDSRDRRDDRDAGRRGRGSRGRRDDYSDEDDLYGGYKPRKRQAPPDPSKYDKPLPPGAGPGYISDPFYYLRQNVPTDPAEAQRLWLEQQLRSRQMVLQQQAASAAAASAKTQRELYIGNLVPGAVTDVALRQLFNTTLVAAFPVTGSAEPVVNVNLHSDGRYAFVEFRTPEMATAALALNAQVQLLGQTISVGRPSGYVDPQKAAAAAQAAAQALAAFQNVLKEIKRGLCFVARGISVCVMLLREAALVFLARAGPRSIVCVLNKSTLVSAGDMAALAANATAAGMNLAQLGLANLVLPKPAEGADTAPAVAATASASAPPSREQTPTIAATAGAGGTLASGCISQDPDKEQQQQAVLQLLQPQEKEGDGQQDQRESQQERQRQEQHPATSVEGEGDMEVVAGANGTAVVVNGDDAEAAAAAAAATRFFCVLGMLNADMLLDDEEYEAVIDDLKDECDRHAPGNVVAVKVPRPPEEVRAQTADFIGIGQYGKAFVCFKDATSAQRAHAAIHGRLFAGNTVQVQYITEEEFNARGHHQWRQQRQYQAAEESKTRAQSKTRSRACAGAGSTYLETLATLHTPNVSASNAHHRGCKCRSGVWDEDGTSDFSKAVA
ncbi:hypothetical protein VOLCADRAFT_89331 [Volvox carteri f. nagariensis]|uniref:RRM domain-containing protein n=1 Tax=Volvox carteri f. nagariensis TaxID=3068 RepID=D8TRF4_VOLCA|nr:uncharacterized protein VOLCADRAFT_89331 [Volvox carteri f. nagariensis]EFJ49883.1 hypothetical protein VOLCADRAFT_89331 [Volvox carteri f. nagariensis]|eukprot:XP_002948948.1 hypothetical protein VOLCADRAFT_89331 [Volvox carteri f. nagariensis]